MAQMRLGAQLFTVREHTGTIPEVAETFRKVAEIGYSAVQMSGFGPVDAEELARVITDSGLTVAATHVAWERFRDDIDGVIEDHKRWNCLHPAIGGLFDESYHGPDGVKRFVDELTPVAEKLAAAGMDFSYHNHDFELARYGDKTQLEMLYDTAPPEVLKAEIDTYWIAAGGGSPAAWIRRCAGREPLLHVKDMCIAADREIRMAEVGEGNLDWPAILDAARAGGVEWALVEQDSCYDRDPFESLTISYRNLTEMGLS